MMMSFIHSHYADQIQLDDIADFAHVSKNTCMQIFKNGIRQSPISYLIQYRLKKAAKTTGSHGNEGYNHIRTMRLSRCALFLP